MIRKSGNRFAEKIMLKEQARSAVAIELQAMALKPSRSWHRALRGKGVRTAPPALDPADSA
jgi:hypothetical protein